MENQLLESERGIIRKRRENTKEKTMRWKRYEKKNKEVKTEMIRLERHTVYYMRHKRTKVKEPTKRQTV